MTVAERATVEVEIENEVGNKRPSINWVTSFSKLLLNLKFDGRI